MLWGKLPRASFFFFFLISISSSTQPLCICCDSFIFLLCTSSAAFIAFILGSVGLWADWTTVPNASIRGWVPGTRCAVVVCLDGRRGGPAPAMCVRQDQISHERWVCRKEVTQGSLQWCRQWGTSQRNHLWHNNVLFISSQQKLRNCHFQPGKVKVSSPVPPFCSTSENYTETFILMEIFWLLWAISDTTDCWETYPSNTSWMSALGGANKCLHSLQTEPFYPYEWIDWKGASHLSVGCNSKKNYIEVGNQKCMKTTFQALLNWGENTFKNNRRRQRISLISKPLWKILNRKKYRKWEA